MKLEVSLSTGLAGAIFLFMILLVTPAVIPPVVPMIVTILVMAYILRDEGVSGQYSFTVAIMFLLVAVGVVFFGLMADRFIWGEVVGFVIFGVWGIVYEWDSRKPAKIPGRNSSASNGSPGATDAVFGLMTLGYMTYLIKSTISVGSFVTIGVAPTVIINWYLRSLELGGLFQLLADISAFATIGIILAAAYLLDTASRLKRSINRIRSPREFTTERQYQPSGLQAHKELAHRPTQELRNVLISLITREHDDYWIEKEETATNWYYCSTGQEDELVIFRRTRTMPAVNPEEIVLRDVQDALATIAAEPKHVTFVTDAILNDELYHKLRQWEIEVIDGCDFVAVTEEAETLNM